MAGDCPVLERYGFNDECPWEVHCGDTNRCILMLVSQGLPIETAPRDGKRVLIGPVAWLEDDRREIVVAAKWGWNALRTREGWFLDDGYLISEKQKPTHWWPLPEVPHGS